MPDRRSLALVASGVAALALPASAGAATETRAAATGRIVVTWAGDPALGCAEAGVCDVRGGVVAATGAARAAPGFDLDVRREPVRVVRGPAEDPAGVCSDPTGRPGESSFQLVPRPGHLELAVLTTDEGEGLSSGRCAGPRAADLTGALPRLPGARVRPLGTTRLDFTGSRPFTAGAFRGTVVSTVVVTVRRRRVADPAGRRPPSGGRERRPRLVARPFAVLEAAYRVESLHGGLGVALGAPAAPGCRLLDACGLGGSVALAVLPAARPPELRITAETPVARRPPSAAEALAAVGAGRLPVVAGTAREDGLRGTVTAEVTRGGAVACRDRAPAALPPLAAFQTTDDEVTLALGSPDYVATADALRTRCPGPGSRALVGESSLAAGRIPVADLAAEAAEVRLTPPPARPGTLPARLSGELVVRLRRTWARVRVERRRVPAGDGT